MRQENILFILKNICKVNSFIESSKLLIKTILLYFKFKLSKTLNISITSEKILGKRIFFHSYRQFFILFIDIFVERQQEVQMNHKKPIIVDLGACFGLSTIYYKNKYPNSIIHAFEPDKENFSYLKENCRNLTQVHIYNIAISDTKGKKTFYVDTSPTHTGSTLNQKKASSFDKKTLVNTDILENFVNHIDLLKIDIEGSETKVLTQIFKSGMTIKNILIEYHYNKENVENALSKIISLAENNNFFYMIQSRQQLPFKKRFKQGYCLNILLYK